MMQIEYRRPDGTFVAVVNGMPYHVLPDDPLFMAAQEAGADAPFEPVVEPEPAAPPQLEPNQWDFFLDLSGFRGPLDAALAAMPKTTMPERVAWAGMKAIATSSKSYGLDVTLGLVARVRALDLVPPVDIPSDEAITEAFMGALAFDGAASLLE